MSENEVKALGGGLVAVDPVEQKKLAAILGHGGGGLVLPEPFVREIFLVECRIAGTTHVENIDAKTAALEPGSILKFLRESDNKYDALAIQILNDRGERIGYVPRDKNEVLARLMDGGKLIYGQVQDKELIDDWWKIKIKIFLKDV